MRITIAAAAGVLLFAVLGWSVHGKERILRDGVTVLVPLGPRDPRSLMQGDYMALRYAVPDRILRAAEQRGRRRGLLVVKLDAQGRASFERLGETSEELGSREHLLAYFWRGRSVDVGASGFFFEEGAGEAYSAGRFGELRVSADGTSVLVGLRDANLRPLGRELPRNGDGH